MRASPKGVVSVVIVSFFTGPVLFRSIRSILRAKQVAQVILIDNGNHSEDLNILESLAGEESGLEIVSGHGNIGFAKACNLGAKRANCDVLLFTNPDCIIPETGVQILLSEVGQKPRPWLIGGRLTNPDGSEQPGSRRRNLSPLSVTIEVTGLHHFFPAYRINQHQEPLPGHTIEVAVISGACMMLPREDYWSVGGMDEKYFLHFEDVDFCVRFRKSGGTVYFCPTVPINHQKGSSQVRQTFVGRHKIQGLMYYFYKHFMLFR